MATILYVQLGCLQRPEVSSLKIEFFIFGGKKQNSMLEQDLALAATCKRCRCTLPPSFHCARALSRAVEENATDHVLGRV